MRHNLFGAIIAECQHRSAAFAGLRIEWSHHRRGALRDGGEAVDADIHRHQEVVERDVEIFAAQRLFVGETDGMDNEVDCRPARRQLFKSGVKIGHVGNVAIDQEIAAQLLGQRAHALFHHFTLIADRQLGTLGLQPLRDAPSERLVIGEAHDEATFPCHQSGHFWTNS